MKKDEIIIIGAGGHSKVVLSTAKLCNYKIISLWDDDIKKIGTKFYGIDVKGPLEKLKGKNLKGIIAIGDNKKRKELAEKLNLSFVKIVHPFSFVDENVEIEGGTVIFAGVVVQPGCKIGRNVIINTGATVDHDCTIGDYVHIAPGVHICGGCVIDEGALIGVGASVIPNKKIGKWSIVGANTAVTKDLPEKMILKRQKAIEEEVKD